MTSSHSTDTPASDYADRVLAVLAASAHAATAAASAAAAMVPTSPPPAAETTGPSGASAEFGASSALGASTTSEAHATPAGNDGGLPPTGRPGETETLQLFQLDGLLEAVEWANEGVAADEAACMWLAGLRWGRAVTGGLPKGAPDPLPRWIDDAAAALPRPFAPGDPLNLAGFSRPEMSSTGRSHVPGIDSAGVLPRAAAVALLPHVDEQTTARFATDAAALTHGSPGAQQAAAQAALMLRAGVENGRAAVAAWEAQAGADVVPGAGQAGAVVVPGEARATLRAALSAAAAAVVRHADDPRAAYASTLGALVPEASGPASGYTGADAASFGAALVAAVFGTAALPENWREATPAAALVLGMQERWVAATTG